MTQPGGTLAPARSVPPGWGWSSRQPPVPLIFGLAYVRRNDLCSCSWHHVRHEAPVVTSCEII